MKIQKATIELIKKYAKYRSVYDERIKEEHLMEAFLGGTKEERRIYTKEMNKYIELVDQGKLKKGMPLETLDLPL